MHRGNILVMGATGGVGKVLVENLSKSGYRIFATYRTKKDKNLLEAQGVYQALIRMNLGQNKSIAMAFEELQESGVDSLDAVINCAAICKVCVLENLDEKELRETFQVNVFGPLYAAQLSIPLLRKSKGRLIFVGSAGGDLVMPTIGAYSASKRALEAMVDALRRELAPWKIAVSIVIPGGIKTNTLQRQLKDLELHAKQAQSEGDQKNARLYRSHGKRMAFAYKIGLTGEKVAEAIEKALSSRNPKPRYYVGIESMLVNSTHRFISDSLQDKLIESAFKEEDRQTTA